MEQLHQSEMQVTQLRMREVELQEVMARQLEDKLQLEDMNRCLIEMCASQKAVVVAGDDPTDAAEYELIIEEEPPKPLKPWSSRIPVKPRHVKPRPKPRHEKPCSKLKGRNMWL